MITFISFAFNTIGPDAIYPNEALRQYRIGSNFCLDFNDLGTRRITLDCPIVENPAAFPTPERTWDKNGTVLYSSLQGEDPLSGINLDFFDTNPLLTPGVVDMQPLLFLPNGSLLFDLRTINISLPVLVPPRVNLTRAVFNAILGNWTCRANNSLGADQASTTISECREYQISIVVAEYSKHRLFNKQGMDGQPKSGY